MRISSKGRYALVSMMDMAQSFDSGKFTTVISIAEKYGISKIYLEQVFSLLKRGGLVISVKGAQGGYQLSRSPEQISVYDILFAIESTLFEETEETVAEASPAFEKTLRASVFEHLDKTIVETLIGISLFTLTEKAAAYTDDQTLMFYI